MDKEEPDFTRWRSVEGRGKSIHDGVGRKAHAGLQKQLYNILGVYKDVNVLRHFS